MKLFAQLGLDKCSTREIAKESDANISLISYYFGGKEGLYKEVMRQHITEVKESVQNNMQNSAFKPGTKEFFVEEVSSMVESMIRFRVNNPEMAKIFAREKLTGMMHSKEIHEEIVYPLIQKFVESFKQGQRQGYIQAGIDPTLFFITLSEGIWGFFQMRECPMRLSEDMQALASDLDQVKNQILQIYLRGVLT